MYTMDTFFNNTCHDVHTIIQAPHSKHIPLFASIQLAEKQWLDNLIHTFAWITRGNIIHVQRQQWNTSHWNKSNTLCVYTYMNILNEKRGVFFIKSLNCYEIFHFDRMIGSGPTVWLVGCRQTSDAHYQMFEVYAIFLRKNTNVLPNCLPPN